MSEINSSEPSVEPKKFNDIQQAALECCLCKCRKKCTQVVFGTGALKARLMIIGCRPSKEDDIVGATFEDWEGKNGLMLAKIVGKAGIGLVDIYTTNLVKCYSVDRPSSDEVRSCKSHLWNEIQYVKPKVIITLGAIVTETLTKQDFKKSIGQVLTQSWTDAKIIPTLHPQQLFTGGKKLVEDVVGHFELAKGIIDG